METLAWTAIGPHKEPLGSYRGLPSDGIRWDYNAPSAIPEAIGGCCFSPAIAEADFIGPIGYATRVASGWGRGHKAEMRQVFGTCRMGTDPRRSVVDTYGRGHRWRNLFIADASLFPSSGGGERPSLTIEALALRNAAALHRRAQRGEL